MPPSTALRRARPLLGTLVEIAVRPAAGQDERSLNEAIDAAFAAIAMVHDAMSPQQPASDLARFNAPGLRSLKCHPQTAAVLAAARALEAASGGAFDATQQRGGGASWSLQGLRLTKQIADAQLDLGGIAKGHAVDLAVAALRCTGVVGGWVNAGGDLRVFGAHRHPVHIRSLVQPERTRPLLVLEDGAFATSVLPGPDGAPLHVSVAAPECLWADALTKVAAYADRGICETVLAAHGARCWRHDPF